MWLKFQVVLCAYISPKREIGVNVAFKNQSRRVSKIQIYLQVQKYEREKKAQKVLRSTKGLKLQKKSTSL